MQEKIGDPLLWDEHDELDDFSDVGPTVGATVPAVTFKEQMWYQSARHVKSRIKGLKGWGQHGNWGSGVKYRREMDSNAQNKGRRRKNRLKDHKTGVAEAVAVAVT